MLKIDPELREKLWLARKEIINNAWQLLQTSVHLFEKEDFTVSCFLAMTSIEEVGKLVLIRMAHGLHIEGLSDQILVPTKIDNKTLQKFIQDHLHKAVQAAAWSLYINAGADRRHGIHPISKIHRTSGVVLLARSGHWMEIRNNCLYTDVNLASKLLSSPKSKISRNHAYYFICMALEVIAEQSESGFGIPLLETPDSHEAFQFWQDRLSDLDLFMKNWSKDINVDDLEFLKDPEPLRKKAEEKELKKAG